MVGAPDIAAGLRYLGEVDAGWRCLNPARFRIAPLKLRFSHGVDSVPLPGTGDVPLALSVRDAGSAPYFLPRNSIRFGFPFKIDGIGRTRTDHPPSRLRPEVMVPLFAVPGAEGYGRERGGGGVPEGDTAATPAHRHDGGATMRTAIAMPGNTIPDGEDARVTARQPRRRGLGNHLAA